jgi:cellulose synthase/poly-beta-1,6-N-acetylglucosamine synthase-like glycosyltransferase
MNIANWIIFIAYFISLYIVVFWILIFWEKGAKDKVRELKKFPFVSVCIPAYNEEKNIIETITSVLNLDYPKDKLEIIVVNDGSKDKTKEVVEKFIKKSKHKIIILLNQINQGKAVAMNNALARAKGEYFVSLDADSIVHKNTLRIILPHFTKNVGAVLPTIKVQSKDTFMRKIQYCEYFINFFYKRVIGNLDCIHVTPGPFSIYKTEIVRKLGGYDPNNLVEDMELALKIQKQHYRIKQLLVREAVVETKAPSNIFSFSKQRNRWYKGAVLNIFKYKEISFNKKYGDFGLFFFPMIIISTIAGLSLFVLLMLTMLIKSIIPLIFKVFLIDLDFAPLIVKNVTEFSILSVNYQVFFMGVMLLFFSMIFLVSSFKYANESIIKNLDCIIPYIVCYPYILAKVWIVVFLDLIVGRKQKW